MATPRTSTAASTLLPCDGAKFIRSTYLRIPKRWRAGWPFKPNPVSKRPLPNKLLADLAVWSCIRFRFLQVRPDTDGQTTANAGAAVPSHCVSSHQHDIAGNGAHRQGPRAQNP